MRRSPLYLTLLVLFAMLIAAPVHARSRSSGHSHSSSHRSSSHHSSSSHSIAHSSSHSRSSSPSTHSTHTDSGSRAYRAPSSGSGQTAASRRNSARSSVFGTQTSTVQAMRDRNAQTYRESNARIARIGDTTPLTPNNSAPSGSNRRPSVASSAPVSTASAPPNAADAPTSSTKCLCERQSYCTGPRGGRYCWTSKGQKHYQSSSKQ